MSVSDPSHLASRSQVTARTARRVLAAVLLGGLAAAVAQCGTANATAQDTNSLQSITPDNGVNLETSPTEIVLVFNQELRDDDQVIVALACGAPVQQPQNTGDPEVDDDGLVVRVPINTPVPSGACTITWRLVAADSTEIANDFTTFRVNTDPVPATTTLAPGATSAPTTLAVDFVQAPTGGGSEATATPEGSSGGAEWLGRLISTLGILALFGGLALIALGWPEGPEYVVTVRYLRAMWVLALVGTILYLIAYSSRVNDISFGGAMNPTSWLDLNDAGWPGRGALLRLVLVGASGWVAMRPERIIDPTTAMWAWGIPGAALIAVALSRVEGPVAWLGVLVGLVHLLGSAVWFGGVAMVARVVLAGPGEEDLVHATRAFSRMSTKAMVVTVVTGLIQMLRLVGNPFTSGHGQVLLLKVVAVAAMLAVGVAARQQVAFRLDRAHEMTVPLADRFRRAFGAEAAIGVVVLAFSGWLLALTPARVDPLGGESYIEETFPFVDTATGIDAEVFIGPGRVGVNGFKIEVNDPADGITNMTLRFVPPPGSNVPGYSVPIPLTTSGTAVLRQEIGLPLQAPGPWTLVLSASTATGNLQGAQAQFTLLTSDGSQPSVPGPTNATVPGGSIATTVVTQPANSATFATTAPPPPPSPVTTG